MNTYGTLFKITLYGESHQEAIGIVVDGMPAGIKLDLDLIKHDLDLRRPGAVGTTPRVEDDAFRITSGLFNGITTGSPVHLMIENKNVISKDYKHLVSQPRPGHADFVASVKYKGFHDYRGGGRFSGRLTAPLVAAGAMAKQFLPFKFSNQIIQLGSLTDMSQMDEYLSQIKQTNDSVGGIVELRVKEMSVGLGEPMFHKLDAEIAKMMFSIPAVKGVSIGTGFEGAHLLGSQFNDVFEDKRGHTKTNHSGGVSGGISNGNDLVVKVFVKPTSSIQKEQTSFNFESNQKQNFIVGGRHDIAIIRRVGIVLENALAIVLADFCLLEKSYKL